jgi:hypothetical protein
VNLLPTWLAPNLITFVGLLVNVATNLLLIAYNPRMEPGVQVREAGSSAALAGVPS